MKKTRMPDPDAVKTLAEFWDRHDLTDFQDELEQVTEPVFGPRDGIRVPLDEREMKAVERLAKAEGVSREQLVRAWVLQKVAPRRRTRSTKRSAD